MKLKRLGSDELIHQYLGDAPVFVTATVQPTAGYKFEDNQITDIVDNQKLLVIVVGVDAIQVKLPADFKVKDEDLQFKQVEFKNLTASAYQDQLYFKAEGMRVKAVASHD